MLGLIDRGPVLAGFRNVIRELAQRVGGLLALIVGLAGLFVAISEELRRTAAELLFAVQSINWMEPSAVRVAIVVAIVVALVLVWDATRNRLGQVVTKRLLQLVIEHDELDELLMQIDLGQLHKWLRKKYPDFAFDVVVRNVQLWRMSK